MPPQGNHAIQTDLIILPGKFPEIYKVNENIASLFLKAEFAFISSARKYFEIG